MILTRALVSSILVAGQVTEAFAIASPEMIGGSAHNIYHRHAGLHEQLRRNAYNVVNNIDRRQNSPAATAGPPIAQSGNAATTDPGAWDVQTSQACSNALSALNGQASNPSGMAACYNIILLSNSTGVFEAELRIYNVSAPIDPWIGIAAQNMSITISYSGASVQHMEKEITRRDAFLSERYIEEGNEAELTQRETKTSEQLKVSRYVGQINSDLMQPQISALQLQNLLVPIITLSALHPNTKREISTPLPPTEASFVNGVFANQSATSTAPAVATGTAFQLPGVTLGIFPVGFVITAVWATLFLGTIGFGTVGRIRSRDHYRQALKLEMVRHIRRI